MSNKPPRKHHFVQAEHIRQFTNTKGLVTVFGKDRTKFEEKPEGIFKKRDLNSFQLEGKLDTTFENIATNIENECWPTLKKIILAKKIEQEDIGPIATYLAFSRLRNPNVQKGIAELHREGTKIHARFMDRAGQFDDIGPNPIDPSKGVSQLILEGKIEISVNNAAYLASIEKMMAPLFKILANGFRWSLIESPKKRVIIGDHPLTYAHPGVDFGAYSPPPGGSGCEMAFPLSSSLYLFGSWETLANDLSSEDAVDQLNMRQAMFATRHIAHHRNDKKWAALVRRYKDFSFQMRTETLDFGAGAYQVVRSGVMRNIGSKHLKLRTPLLKTRKIAVT